MAAERRRRGAEGPREARVRARERGAARGERGGRGALGLAAALALGLGLAAAGALLAQWGRWRAASRAVSPHPAAPALPPGATGPGAAPHRFWGSYRPHVYFGMKTRSPRSVVTGACGAGGAGRGGRVRSDRRPPHSPGLMWLQQREGAELRHTCEQSDGLQRYGWLLHDGERFGLQDIHDRGLLLRTEFVKRPGGLHGGDWSWRVTARPEVGPQPGVVPRARSCEPEDGTRQFAAPRAPSRLLPRRARAARPLWSPSSSTWPRTGRASCGRTWRTAPGWRP